MKKITLCLAAAAALLFASCGSDEELNTANQRADSLQTVVDQKDEEIASLFEVLSDIETNLTEISSRYSKVNTLRQQNPERNQKVKGEITDELAVIDNMMAQNKQKIAQLNSKIKSLGAENEKLQNFIETLNARMTEQENQINSLMNELTISKATISKLSANVSDLTRSNKEKDEEIARQNDEMAYLADNSHRAYYVVGTYNDLKEKGIVSKEGGLLFKSQKATNSVNLSKFNLIDRNKVTTIEVNLRKAKLISDHPKGSYEFVMDDTDKKVVKQLVIKDVASFWSKTDFLIISTK
ncbi:MAG: hypothetical protein IJR26_01720 [Bacteroidales bacterium]|nr:hypothetical protein [Bacteroidales bacterium]